MVELTALPPDQMASHLGNPDSEIGIAVAEYMNRVNLTLSEAAYRRLDVADAHHALEIGFGNGRLIPLLVGMAEGVHYGGADISPTMVEEAMRDAPTSGSLPWTPCRSPTRRSIGRLGSTPCISGPILYVASPNRGAC